MKYCIKCGMLLEDTYATCIRCGSDVTKKENISLYPPEILETMDAQREERKNRTTTVAMIIGILVLLAGLGAFAAIGVSKGSFSIPGYQTAEDDSDDEEFEEYDEFEEYEEDEEIDEADEALEDESEVEEVAADEPESDEGEEVAESDDEETKARVVNDAKGDYYNFIKESDAAGNVIFEAIYPEDFDTVDFAVDSEIYSTVYPINMTFIASGEEGAIQFLYMSPRQLWYKDSETGKSYENNRIPDYYMTFYKYDGAKGYIEAMLKESYPKAKIELVNEEEVSAEASAGVKDLAKLQKKDISNKIKAGVDYARIGKGTTYAMMESDSSAFVYEYEITTTDKQMVFDKFYVPVIANTMYYADENSNDRGNMIEWYYFSFAVMEAGNEDLYDDYSPAFDLFVRNAIPTDKFFKICQQYSGDISELVDAKRAVPAITEKELKIYGGKNVELNDFNKMVKNVLTSNSNVFSDGELVVNAPSNAKVVFVDESIGKLFVSSEADEYPGDSYTELLGDADENSGDDAEDVETEEIDEEENQDEESDATSGNVGLL